MRFKLPFIAALTLAIFSLVTPLAQAEYPLKGAECSHCSKCGHSGHGSSYGKGDRDSESGCPIIGAFMKKAHFFLENAEEIGLSEEQVATIKDLKKQVKKLEIQQLAGMQISMMDMEEKLHANPVDIEGLNAMIDKGMVEMAAGAKETVAAYAKLKGVLTPDQMSKAKAIWKKSDK